MTTFSQLVDSIVSETKRPDLVSEIVSYANQTIRECHLHPETSAIQFFPDNARETRLTANREGSFTWAIPNRATFQKIHTVKYTGSYDRLGQEVYPKEVTPGRHLSDITAYYYRVGKEFVFSGFYGINALIDIYWFAYPPSLKYMPANCRPMVFDDFDQKIYSEAWICDSSTEDADKLTTNWILESWSEVVKEGVRAKVYKRLSDTERARTCYSLYAQLRKGLVTAEINNF
jgi:hypothetical protein